MRILIVDDDSATAEMTAECLTMEPGVTVQIANDGATALRAAAEYAPDAILLDIELPDASGIELAPQLKVVCAGHVPRIIIFSGSISEYDPERLPDGVDAWLTKPAHLDVLLGCVVQKQQPR